MSNYRINVNGMKRLRQFILDYGSQSVIDNIARTSSVDAVGILSWAEDAEAAFDGEYGHVEMSARYSSDGRAHEIAFDSDDFNVDEEE